MKTADFDYELPPELIAHYPAPRRDESRLLVLHRRAGTWSHHRFGEVSTYLRTGDLLVTNNTRVYPARLYGRKPGSGGRVELFFLEQLADGAWDVLLRARRRPAPGARIELPEGHSAILLADGELGRATVRVEGTLPVLDLLEAHGETPLPPYIQREENADRRADAERYQTVYAKVPGAVAAPTAGLHFTPELLERLGAQGVRRAEVTLHVGLGTFRPVSAEDVLDHRMEAERFVLPEETAEAVRATHRGGGRVVAVGSTSVRTLEQAACGRGEVTAGEGRTDLFIRPPYAFQVVDAILTNFHLPRSTLLMMMSAFAGRELMLAAYQEAIRERYRFFSYGDAMLIV